MLRDDETLVIREDLTSEFPEGVPKWMVGLPVEEVRANMELRREGFTRQGMNPAEDVIDREPLRVVH